MTQKPWMRSGRNTTLVVLFTVHIPLVLGGGRGGRQGKAATAGPQCLLADTHGLSCYRVVEDLWTATKAKVTLWVGGSTADDVLRCQCRKTGWYLPARDCSWSLLQLASSRFLKMKNTAWCSIPFELTENVCLTSLFSFKTKIKTLVNMFCHIIPKHTDEYFGLKIHRYLRLELTIAFLKNIFFDYCFSCSL